MEDAEESCTILSHITETEKVKEIVNLSDINSHISHNIPINFISTHKILDCNFLLILPRIFPAKNVNVYKYEAAAGRSRPVLFLGWEDFTSTVKIILI